MEIMSTLRRYDRLTVVCNTSLNFFPRRLSSGSHVKLTGGGLLKNVTLSFARPLLFFCPVHFLVPVFSPAVSTQGQQNCKRIIFSVSIQHTLTPTPFFPFFGGEGKMRKMLLSRKLYPFSETENEEQTGREMSYCLCRYEWVPCSPFHTLPGKVSEREKERKNAKRREETTGCAMPGGMFLD